MIISSNNRPSHLVSCHLKYLCHPLNSPEPILENKKTQKLSLPRYPELGSPVTSPFKNVAEYLVLNATVQEGDKAV